MPDYSFIANPSSGTQGINTIGALANIQGQGIQNRSNQAILNEQNNVRSTLQDPNFLKSITDPNSGDIDFTKAIPTILKIAPTQGASILQGMAQAQQSATQAKGSILSLNGQQRQAVGQYLMSQANDPNATPESIQSGMDDLTKQIPQLKGASDFFSKHIIAPNANNPQALRNGLLNAGQQVMTPPQQVSAQQPNYVSTGGQQFNINPLAHGSPQVVNNTIAPSERQNVTTDSQGRPIVISKGAAGGVTDVSGAPVQGQAPTAPFVMPTGENADTLKFVQNLRQNANTTAATVPQQQFNTNQIIHYAENANTGTGAQYLSNLQGQFAPLGALGIKSDSATNFNMLGHAIALQTASLANSAGLNGSNEARGLAQEQTANQNWTKEAVVTSARNMRALATGADLYNQGIENNIAKATQQFGPSSGQFAARTFTNQWSKAANVNAMRLYDAVKNADSDPGGLKAVVTELGGTNGKPYQDALQSIDKMKALISGGKQ